MLPFCNVLSFDTGHMSKQQLPESIDYRSHHMEESTTLPPTYIVVRIVHDVPDTTLVWLVEKIRAKRRDGGAELLVFREPRKVGEVRGFLILN